MTDVIDIVVRDSNTPVVARNLNQVAAAANNSAKNITLMNKALRMIGDGQADLQKIAKEISNAQARVTSLTTELNKNTASKIQNSAATKQQAQAQAAANATLTQTAAVQKTVVSGVTATSKAFTGTAKTAREIQFATRGLPAQFTDIFVSLQAGQNPLNVFLQQGGQLKDMFGGIGVAARAMGGYLLTLVTNPFILAAAAAAALFAVWKTGAAEATAFNTAIIQTGDYANRTANDMQQLAEQLDNVSGVTEHKAAAAITAVANTGRFTGGQFDQVASAVTKWSSSTGESVDSVVQKFVSLADDPLDAIKKLDQSQHFLGESTKAQIANLVDQGNKVAAVNLAVDTYARTLENRTPEMLENLGYLEKAWRAIKTAGAEAIDSLLDAGRAPTLAKLDAQIAQLKADMASPWHMAMFDKDSERQIAALEAAAAPLRAANAAAGVSAANKFLGNPNDRFEKDQADWEALQSVYSEAAVDAAGRSAEAWKKAADKQVEDAKRAAEKAKQEAEKYAREIERLGNSVENVIGEISPIENALKHVARAREILSEAVEKGIKLEDGSTITQAKAAEIMGRLEDRYNDAIHPLEAMNAEMDKQQKTLALSNREAQVEEEVRQRVNELKRKGVDLTLQENAADLAALQAKVATRQELERIARIRDSMAENTSAGQMSDFGDKVKALTDLKNGTGGQFGDGDKFGALTQLLPWANLEGSKEQMDAFTQAHADMYAQIQMLENNQVINHQTATMLMAQADANYHEQRLNSTRGFFGALAGLSSSGNRKLAAIGKGAAMTQATIDGVLAVQKALAAPPGWPYNAPNVIATGVMQAANVAAIASQSTGFRTGGSMIVGGSGGDDSQTVSFRATPGERIQVNTPSQARALEKADQNSSPTVKPNLNVIVVQDPSLVGQYLSSAEGEDALVVTLEKNGYKKN